MNLFDIHLSVYKHTHIVQLVMHVGFSDLSRKEPCSINHTKQKFS